MKSTSLLLTSSLLLLPTGCAGENHDETGESSELASNEGAVRGESSITWLNGMMSSDWPWPERAFSQRPAIPDPPDLYRHLGGEEVPLRGSYPENPPFNMLLIRRMALERAEFTYSGSPLSDEAWRTLTSRAYVLFSHLTSCALRRAEVARLVIHDGSGSGHADFAGRASGTIGLAPEWREGGIESDARARQRVTACMAALSNKFGLLVPMVFVEPSSLAPSSGNRLFTRFEGMYWGDMFQRSTEIFACDNPAERDSAVAVGRQCQLGHCGNIHRLGTCDEACRVDGDGKLRCKDSSATKWYENAVAVFVGGPATLTGRGALVRHTMPPEGGAAASCERGRGALGISLRADGSVGSLLCKRSSDIVYSHDGSAVVDVGRGSVTRADRYDWQGGDEKIECDTDEYVDALDLRDGRLSSVVCERGHVRGDYCRVIRVGASDIEDVERTARALSIEPGEQLAQCGLGEHVAGISVDSRRRPASVLCCLD